TLTAAEVNSGLTLNSHYHGWRHPVATLTVTATDSTTGKSTAPQRITVTDPPATTISQGFALLNQYLASGFGDQTGHGQTMTESSMTSWHDETFLTNPRH